MKIPGRIQRLLHKEQGAVIVLIALLLFVLLGVTAFAIDFGYRHVVRNELQNAADAAALAAARELGEIYGTLTYTEQQTYVADPSTIIPIAQEAALLNYAGDVGSLALNASDVIIGDWDFAQDPSAADPLTPTLNQPDAVRVIIRRDGDANGPIQTFFAPIFGIPTLEVKALATAALSPLSTIEEGGLPIPVGISEEWFDPANWAAEEKGYCDQTIKFYPTGGLSGCAGWNIYQVKDKGSASASDLKKVISWSNPWCDPAGENYNKDYCFKDYDPDFKSPAINGGGNDSFTFTGGVAETALPYFEALYNANKDSDGNWGVTVPVYESDSCQDNPSGQIPIIGFASAVITGIELTPNKTIQAKVICELTEPGRGSGGNFGTNGSVPGLVE
jgi:hypothetical protein